MEKAPQLRQCYSSLPLLAIFKSKRRTDGNVSVLFCPENRPSLSDVCLEVASVGIHRILEMKLTRSHVFSLCAVLDFEGWPSVSMSFRFFWSFCQYVSTKKILHYSTFIYDQTIYRTDMSMGLKSCRNITNVSGTRQKPTYS